MNDTKRQVLPVGLWVVATPIGNLSDMSPRSRWALEEAQHILCEDTRRTATLLSAIGLGHSHAKLKRLDAHTEMQQVQQWVDFLKEGKSIALVSDAGTPSISDPGAVLVHYAHQAGIRVTPIPGVSAVVALLSIAGFQETEFGFRGFFPRKTEEQKHELRTASSSDLASVCAWFESPHRIVTTLEQISDFVGDLQSEIIVAKELTKLHEKVFVGAVKEVAANVRKEVETQGEIGEWCFAVHFPRVKSSNLNDELELHSDPNSDWMKALRCLIGAQISPSEASKRVSQEFGVPKRIIYEAALRISGKKTE